MSSGDNAPAALRTLIERFDPEPFDAPDGRARIRLTVAEAESFDAVVQGDRVRLEPAGSSEPDALLTADASSWQRIGRDLRGGMAAFRSGRLSVRRNLHLGVGFLAATSGWTEPDRLELRRVRTGIGNVAIMQAGRGAPVLLLHGLGATKVSFMPTLAALAPSHRVIAVDLPGFGDSVKPLGARYDAAFFAHSVVALLDALALEHADLVGNSMGGRVALEVGLQFPDRTRRLALLAPSLAWIRERRWAVLVRLLPPELGLVQPTSRRVVEGIVRRIIPGGEGGWAAAGVDEFLRAYCTPRGRAAFYAAARNIYMEEPQGRNGFWPRLSSLEPESLFVWGRRDGLVPIGFARHVQRALPAARHVKLDCGHVPQLERPREAHAAILRFLSTPSAQARRGSAA